jgi:DNA repair photolyase
VERQFRITRGCLEVALDCRQPLYLITKNALIVRDLDLLAEMARQRLVRVVISVTSLDQSLTRTLEPQTSAPAARLAAIESLAAQGIDVVVNVAPIVPGLTDHQVPGILRAVAAAGALAAGYTVLRLNGAVEAVFVDWLDRHRPHEKEKILDRVRALHDGQLYDHRFGDRMRGSGVMAEAIRTTFRTFARRYGIDRVVEPLRTDLFRRPSPDTESGLRQLRMF